MGKEPLYHGCRIESQGYKFFVNPELIQTICKVSYWTIEITDVMGAKGKFECTLGYRRADEFHFNWPCLSTRNC